MTTIMTAPPYDEGQQERFEQSMRGVAERWVGQLVLVLLASMATAGAVVWVQPDPPPAASQELTAAVVENARQIASLTASVGAFTRMSAETQQQIAGLQRQQHEVLMLLAKQRR